jgi:hypothetical protein
MTDFTWWWIERERVSTTTHSTEGHAVRPMCFRPPPTGRKRGTDETMQRCGLRTRGGSKSWELTRKRSLPMFFLHRREMLHFATVVENTMDAGEASGG